MRLPQDTIPGSDFDSEKTIEMTREEIARYTAEHHPDVVREAFESGEFPMAHIPDPAA